jgi:serine/threonine protein kinase
MVTCDHLHIVTLEEALSNKKALYLVMELVSGVDLVELISTM